MPASCSTTHFTQIGGAEGTAAALDTAADGVRDKPKKAQRVGDCHLGGIVRLGQARPADFAERVLAVALGLCTVTSQQAQKKNGQAAGAHTTSHATGARRIHAWELWGKHAQRTAHTRHTACWHVTHSNRNWDRGLAYVAKENVHAFGVVNRVTNSAAAHTEGM